MTQSRCSFKVAGQAPARAAAEDVLQKLLIRPADKFRQQPFHLGRRLLKGPVDLSAGRHQLPDYPLYPPGLDLRKTCRGLSGEGDRFGPGGGAGT